MFDYVWWQRKSKLQTILISRFYLNNKLLTNEASQQNLSQRHLRFLNQRVKLFCLFKKNRNQSAHFRHLLYWSQNSRHFHRYHWQQGNTHTDTSLTLSCSAILKVVMWNCGNITDNFHFIVRLLFIWVFEYFWNI